MPQGIVGPQGITTISPPARGSQVKIGKIDSTDSTTGVAVFGIPKGAFIAGVYTISMGANVGETQTITAGFTASGTEILTSFAPNSTGYAVSGASTGSAVGTQLTADKTVYIKAAAALTNPVYVKVEYWLPPVGQAY
jgi:hypothetical protein